MLTTDQILGLAAKLAPLADFQKRLGELLGDGRISNLDYVTIRGDVTERIAAHVSAALAGRLAQPAAGLSFIVFNLGESFVHATAEDLADNFDAPLAGQVRSWALAAKAGTIASFRGKQKCFSIMCVMSEWIDGQ